MNVGNARVKYLTISKTIDDCRPFNIRKLFAMQAQSIFLMASTTGDSLDRNI